MYCCWVKPTTTDGLALALTSAAGAVAAAADISLPFRKLHYRQVAFTCGHRQGGGGYGWGGELHTKSMSFCCVFVGLYLRRSVHTTLLHGETCEERQSQHPMFVLLTMTSKDSCSHSSPSSRAQIRNNRGKAIQSYLACRYHR